ncbi:primary-amine oxidase, partial [Streptomyces sp. MnatMP-M27]
MPENRLRRARARAAAAIGASALLGTVAIAAGPVGSAQA